MSSAWPTSRDFHAGLTRTAAAPSALIAWTAMTNSGRLETITATRSPGRTPRAARWRALALPRLVDLAEGQPLLAGTQEIALAPPVRGPLQAVRHERLSHRKHCSPN